ncbi:MAG: hypothetical protein MJZ20_02920 [Bacteroidaceae bacterium]|nr:hypothetical protein [Bacteroidaceae bacterium]
MHIVSQKAATALRSKTTFQLQNTKVFRKEYGYTNDTCPMVLSLWDNIIAELFDDGRMFVNMCGWDSRTTCERLRALGVQVHHNRGKLMIGDTEINAYTTYRINPTTGLIED